MIRGAVDRNAVPTMRPRKPTREKNRLDAEEIGKRRVVHTRPPYGKNSRAANKVFEKR